VDLKYKKHLAGLQEVLRLHIRLMILKKILTEEVI